jgi:hypothetical protein
MTPDEQAPRSTKSTRGNDFSAASADSALRHAQGIPSVSRDAVIVSRRGGALELAAVVAAATFLASVLTFPFVAQMTHVGRVDNFDGDFGIWNVSWVARTLIVDPAHVLDANIFYPHRRTLVYSETNLGAGALAIPAYWATRNPYFTFNFAFLLSMVLAATGAYYLVRCLMRDRRAAAVSAIAFAFCAYVFARTPQMQLLMTAGLPFSMLAFHRVADRPSARRAVALGVVMAAQVAFCGYYAVFAMLMVGFGTLVLAATRRLWTTADYWRAIGIAAAVGVAGALPVLVPYMQLQQTTGFGRALNEAREFSADWQAYLASSALAHRWMLKVIGHWNEVLFPGFVATIFGIAGLLIGLRTPLPDQTLDGSRPDLMRPGIERGEQDVRLREVAILYGLLGAIACWASFGPDAGLYTVLYRVIPPFALMRAPARFGIVVTLALAVLAGISVRAWLQRTARPNLIGLMLAVVTAAELAFPLRFREVPPVSRAYKMLATLPVGPVIEFPFYSTRRDLFAHARYMLNSTAHWMPLINGYSDYIPPDFIKAAPTLKLFPSREAFRLLADKRPRYAVFHMGLYGNEDRAAAAARIVEFAAYLTPLYTDDDTRLYEIVGFPQ